jgi:PAS domain S-box-containing protein
MPDATERTEGTILCADDTEAQRYAMARVLRRAGFRVIEASTARGALELSSTGPDLIVLDVNLPDMNGIEVCRHIKSNESTSRIPVLQVSATLVSTEARVAGLEGGADAYLVQPIDPDELTATIRALLRTRRADEALWKSQLQYRSFFEANPLPCLVFDSQNLAILAVNAAAVQFYGYSREEFVGLSLGDVFAPRDQEAVSAFLTEQAPWAVARNYQHRKRDGRSADVEMICAPLELNGKDVRLAIVQDITERLALQEAEKNEEIRGLLLERVLQAQEDERRRIARELHDEAGQLMTSLLVGLRTLSDVRRLADAKSQAIHLREIASNAIAELGRLSRGLHSSVLDDLGFETALRRYCDDFSRAQKILVDTKFCDNDFSGYSRDEQLNLYRIVQEALTNVGRHSRAKNVAIQFHRLGDQMELTVRDDGRGLPSGYATSTSTRGHLGIEGMRQRAAILGGSLQLTSNADAGLLLSLRIPAKDAKRPEAVVV